MERKLLVAAAMVCAAMAPALAYSQSPTSGSIKAVDDAWQASPGGESTLTLTRTATVEFSYPSGASAHAVHWTSDAKPTCQGVPTTPDYGPAMPGWKGTCTFRDDGVYQFACWFHPEMTGTVKVEAPAASPSPSPSPSASPSPTATSDGGTPTTPGTTPQPTPTPVGGPAPKALAVKLASTQKGTRVRGSVKVSQPSSRVEVTVRLGKTRLGHWLKPAAASGNRAFTVALNARGRKELKRRKTLKLTVAVAVTPPKAAKQARTFSVKLRG